FLFTGPLSHYFYLYLEQLIPSEAPFALVKRLLVDRLIVSPAFLALFFLVMNFLEVGSCLGMIILFFFIPLSPALLSPVTGALFFSRKFQVLFGNLVAMLWFAYLASVKKR
ncbi:peroxisomal membrane protein 2, partial [Protobothrops mucrosquamatus]|uniref:peroxisomal membrane protein 2 n=1 Tax=Protobothrops mucrosquamatus TaxID=103944 RepID=UPI0010FB0B90